MVDLDTQIGRLLFGDISSLQSIFYPLAELLVFVFYAFDAAIFFRERVIGDLLVYLVKLLGVFQFYGSSVIGIFLLNIRLPFLKIFCLICSYDSTLRGFKFRFILLEFVHFLFCAQVYFGQLFLLAIFQNIDARLLKGFIIGENKIG